MTRDGIECLSVSRTFLPHIKRDEGQPEPAQITDQIQYLSIGSELISSIAEQRGRDPAWLLCLLDG